jgi:hypothetical protein
MVIFVAPKLFCSKRVVLSLFEFFSQNHEKTLNIPMVDHHILEGSSFSVYAIPA